MNRPAAPSDFTIQVENIGSFVFGRRTRRDNFRIAAEYHRLTEGTDPGQSEFGLQAEAYATLSTLLVDGPEGFDKLLALDEPGDDDGDDVMKVVRVFLALRQKELSFRPRPNQAGQGEGQADGEQHGVLVPPAVQPAADGPQVS